MREQMSRRARGHRRTIGPTVAGLGIVVLLLGGMAVIGEGNEWQRLRELAGLGDRLGPVPTAVEAGGSFRFVATQPGSAAAPVGYDPCRPVRYEVNPEGAPANGAALVEAAVTRIEETTGLVFEHVGETDSRDFTSPTRATGRAPALVGWADEREVPDLAGDAVGLGGSTWVQEGMHREFVTGLVVLEAAWFASVEDDPDAQARAAAVVLHEFAHLVGLAHVSDPRELMHDGSTGVVQLGPGDLEGLARLGRVPCG